MLCLGIRSKKDVLDLGKAKDVSTAQSQQLPVGPPRLDVMGPGIRRRTKEGHSQKKTCLPEARASKNLGSQISMLEFLHPYSIFKSCDHFQPIRQLKYLHGVNCA